MELHTVTDSPSYVHTCKTLGTKISSLLKSTLYKSGNGEGELYALTISPPENKYSIDFNYNSYQRIIVVELRKACKHFCIVPEFSETGRLHFHGIIRIDDEIKFYRRVNYILRNIGFVKLTKIKTFADHMRYMLYMYKEKYRTLTLLVDVHTNKDPITVPYYMRPDCIIKVLKPRDLKLLKQIELAERKSKTILDYL